MVDLQRGRQQDVRFLGFDSGSIGGEKGTIGGSSSGVSRDSDSFPCYTSISIDPPFFMCMSKDLERPLHQCTHGLLIWTDIQSAADVSVLQTVIPTLESTFSFASYGAKA